VKRQIERLHTGDELGPIGEVEVADAFGNAGFDQAVRPVTVGLEGSACVDEDVGLKGTQLRREIAAPIECSRHEFRAGRRATRAAGGGPRQ